MAKILGLDLGTNSIGWALIDSERKCIEGIGTRIIPMSQDILGEFDRGNSVSTTAERTRYRGVRRLRERHLLRRERLHRVLNILSFLPDHYKQQIDFENHPGQFRDETEPKIAYRFNVSGGKHEFIFLKSFNEMIEDFRNKQPEPKHPYIKVPYDWTIYYLRKKALTCKIEKEELAWLLLNFNQKRGYFQLRGEEEDLDQSKLVEFYSLKVIDVVDSGEKKGKDGTWYNVLLENGWVYRRTSKTPLDWKGKTKDFIITTELDQNGNVKKDKEGKEKRTFRAPNEDDWTLIKKKTEADIVSSHKTVGCYIYDTLLQNTVQKIRGKLVRTIERKFYRDELKQILTKQKGFHPELNDGALYQACIKELYPNNDAHRNSISSKDFVHLFIEDIIFYQRPLKSKKSLIRNCQYEVRKYYKDGKLEEEPLKCIPKSHPLFQEFRLWQFLHNIRIYERTKIVSGKLHTDFDVTNEYLKSDADRAKLFEWLNEREEVDQKAFLKYFKLKPETHRWNYVEDKKYPCNKTHYDIVSRLAKMENLADGFLSPSKEEHLWHILYSVEDKKSTEKALNTFASKNGLGNDFVDHFLKFPRIDKEYGSYSEKAIKKLLPLMRIGRYWNEEDIANETKKRIDLIIKRLESINYDERRLSEVTDDDIPKQVLRSFLSCHGYHGLNTYQACYAVYGRHSESGEIRKWVTPKDIEYFLKNDFKQHSLRNPIVEQVISETLRVIRDIWIHYGRSEQNFFNEIHVELGRKMKNPPDKRKKITEQVTENENTNLRIKALLSEMINDGSIDGVRPYSPGQQEILKIYEEGVLNSFTEVPDDILKISKKAQPSKSELVRYKLWLDQKYRSPYTGEMIPFSKLFTSAYEIEHIIPQSRYYDDSLSNKVICESEVNKDKGNCTAYEYIKNNQGKKLELSFGKAVTLFTAENYERNVRNNFRNLPRKMKYLLMEEIPDSFIARQLNDTRYISKVVMGLLSNIVREDGEQESTSKNVLSTNGAITSVLRQDWGLNDIWNKIVTPRFERLNVLTNSNNYGRWVSKEGKSVFQSEIPIESQKGFSKKRIDHRHHALDALVIACATRNHINYLNNESALSHKRYQRFDLRTILCHKKHNGNGETGYKWIFNKPWETFSQDAYDALTRTIVSFKQNLRVINKTINYYEKWVTDSHGNKNKEKVKQSEGVNWAIRKPLHSPMPYGKRNYDFDILKIYDNLGKSEFIIDKNIFKVVQEIIMKCNGKVTHARKYLKDNPITDNDGNKILEAAFQVKTEKFRRRQPILKLANRGQGGIKSYDDAKKFIDKIADKELRNELLEHLRSNNNDIELAFSSDGIDKFNENRKVPVFNLPIAEKGTERFNLGFNAHTKHKWVEAEKGTNLFFAVYQDDEGKRKYKTIPLDEVIERQKQGLGPVQEQNDSGDKLLFYLSPNDLVYIPIPDEQENPGAIDFSKITNEMANRIYKMVSCTGSQCMFVRHDISNPIVNKFEFSPLNKMEKSLDGIMIKDVCWKLKVDRLGRVTEVNDNYLRKIPVHESGI